MRDPISQGSARPVRYRSCSRTSLVDRGVDIFQGTVYLPHFVLSYRPAHENFCPACGHSAWHVGRITATCAICEHTLPLNRTNMSVIN